MKPNQITAPIVGRWQHDIDTDQIFPARFLLTEKRQGLGDLVFKDKPLPKGDPEQTRVLVTGKNFGCGSSREHAVWALLDAGFRAIIAPSFGPIFKNNALKNGLIVIESSDKICKQLATFSARPITIDLESCKITHPQLDSERDFFLDPFSHRCLKEGWDQLDYLLSFHKQIESFFEKSHQKEPIINEY